MLILRSSLTLTITCTCYYDVINGIQDLKIYSHADSLSLTLSFSVSLHVTQQVGEPASEIEALGSDVITVNTATVTITDLSVQSRSSHIC